MARRQEIGDVVEIPTSGGRAYAQFTHKHAQFGALLRVLPGLHASRPLDGFIDLVSRPPSFSTFFPLGLACNRGICEVVASVDVPAHTKAFPLLRTCVIHRDQAGVLQVGPMWLWDGENEWLAGKKDVEQLMRHPPRGLVYDTLLIERILCGWRHEDWPPAA